MNFIRWSPAQREGMSLPLAHFSPWDSRSDGVTGRTLARFLSLTGAGQGCDARWVCSFGTPIGANFP